MKLKKESKVRLAIMALLLCLLFTACGSSTDSPGKTPTETTPTEATQTEDTTQPTASDMNSEKVMTISWWGSETRADITIAACEMYMEQNPGVRFEYQYPPADDYWTVMNTRAAADTLPDIMQQDYALIETWTRAGNLKPMDLYVDDGTIDTSKWDKAAYQAGYVDGKLMGIQNGSNAFVLIYDKTIADKAGVSLEPGYSWEDLMAYSKKIYEETGAYSQLHDPTEFLHIINLIARERGYEMFSKDGKSWGFPDPSIIETAFQYQKDLQDAGIALDVELAKEKGRFEENLITTGEQWFVTTFSNYLISFAGVAENEIQLACLPKSKDAKRWGQYLKPTNFMSISDDCKPGYESSAAAFINFFINDIDANIMMNGERGVPTNSEARAALAEATTDESLRHTLEFFSTFSEYCTDIYPPFPPQNVVIQQETLPYYFDSVVYGKMSCSDAAKGLFDEGNKILSTN